MKSGHNVIRLLVYPFKHRTPFKTNIRRRWVGVEGGAMKGLITTQ